MEYQQITLTEWQDMKKEIERDLLNVKLAFVRIGYNLRKIEEKELYRQDGYTSIAEFAKEEYGLGASTVSRFIAINKRFSIDGNSQFLDTRYTQYKSSALQEMLTLPDNDLEMITPETKRETIRELKKFNKDAEKAEAEQEPVKVEQKPAETEQKPAEAEPEAEKPDMAPGTPGEIKTAQEETKTPSAKEPKAEASPLENLVRAFFEENPKILDRLYRTGGFPIGETAAYREMVNPSGSRSVRSEAWILIMNESDLKWKRFGGKPETLSWEEFFEETDRIYAPQAAEAGNDNILGWKKEAEGQEHGKTGIKEVDKEKAGRDTVKADGSAGGTEESAERAEGIQDKGPETDGGDPGEHDEQPEEEGHHGEPDRQAGEQAAVSGGTDPEDGRTEPAGGPVAPVQEPGNEAEKTGETGGMPEEEDSLKSRLVNTAGLLLADLQNEDWSAAEHRLHFIKVWLEEIWEKE